MRYYFRGEEWSSLKSIELYYMFRPGIVERMLENKMIVVV